MTRRTAVILACLLVLAGCRRQEKERIKCVCFHHPEASKNVSKNLD